MGFDGFDGSFTSFYRWYSTVGGMVIASLLVYLGLVVFKTTPMRRLHMLAALYPFGKGIQMWFEIPGFIRWHLSDLGFIPFTIVCLRWVPMLRGLDPLDALRRAWRVGITLAVGSELIQLGWKPFIIPSKLSELKSKGVPIASGDWMDLLIFIMVGWYCHRVIYQMERAARQVQARRSWGGRKGKRRRVS